MKGKYVIYRMDKDNKAVNESWSSKTLFVPFEGEIEKIQLYGVDIQGEKTEWEQLTSDLIILPCHDEICIYLKDEQIIEKINLHHDEILYINCELKGSVYFYSEKGAAYYKLFIKFNGEYSK